VGPRAIIDVLVKRETPCTKSNPSHPARSQITVLTELPWLDLSSQCRTSLLCEIFQMCVSNCEFILFSENFKWWKNKAVW
jgi:hypothetical protein